jgi:DNA-binding NtrC family response regulator
MSPGINESVVIIEYPQGKGGSEVSDHLLETLQQCVNSKARYVNDLADFPPLPQSPSLLVVIVAQQCPSEAFSQFCSRIKGIYSRVSIIGVFCQTPENPHEDFISLLAQMDDYLLYPFTDTDLLFRVRKVMRSKVQGVGQSSSRMQRTHDDPGPFVVGESSSFRSCMEKIRCYAESDETVLICGETGTGKDLCARVIHSKSRRYDKPFVPVNCGALPDHLCENELFGHAKGAFTDAATSEKGLIAESEGGTLFLDEIGTLSTSAQTRLLRFLQDREYRPLGSSKSVVANVRVVAATNSRLDEMVASRQFREDLYYRLSVLPVFLPPLRERLEDIPRLAVHFLKKQSKMPDSSSVKLSTEAIQKLLAYRWPGNIRELEAVMCRTAMLNGVSFVTPDQIEFQTEQSLMGKQSSSLRDAKKQNVDQFEKSYLITLMHSAKGNVSHAAKSAGKQRRSLQRLLQKYGIQRQSFLQ